MTDKPAPLHLEYPNVAPMRGPVRIQYPPATVELRWPNGLGKVPTDAIGKRIALDAGPCKGEYSVAGVDGERLILTPAQ